MRGCCVPMCKSNKKWDKISFHEMPSNEELREKWAEAIMKHAPPKNSQWYPDQYDLVCAKHFTDDDYRPTCTVRCLKSGAIPSVFEDSPDSSEHFIKAVSELDFEEIDSLRNSKSCSENTCGTSTFRPISKNLNQIKKVKNCTEKRLTRTKKLKGNTKKQNISSCEFSTKVFASQTPTVTHLSRMSFSRTVDDDDGDDDASPSSSINTSVHHSPRLKKGISLLSNEVVRDGQQILQEETLDCCAAADVNNFKTKSSYKNFLMNELDTAHQEISCLQACITRLKQQNVKLQWEKNSVLVTHLHDIKQDAVDGNYDAIILLNRIAHYSLQRTCHI